MAFWRRRRDEPKEPEPAVPAEPPELDAPAELEAPAPDPVPDKAVPEGTFEIEGSDGNAPQARKIQVDSTVVGPVTSVDAASRMLTVLGQNVRVDADTVFDLMRTVNETSGTTFLIVTHDPRLARRCDRIVELVDGSIVADRPNRAERRGASLAEPR